MLVETFEVTESLDAQPEAERCEEALQLIKALDLEGQKKFFGLEEESEDQLSVFPYRRMTAQEQLVYEILCPQKTPLNEYESSLLPLRVLQVAAHANEIKDLLGGHETTLCVWHPRDAVTKDPLLVLDHQPKSYEHHWYVLARWGDVLDNLDVLKEEAKKRWVAHYQATVESIEKKVALLISDGPIRFEEAYMKGRTSANLPCFYD